MDFLNESKEESYGRIYTCRVFGLLPWSPLVEWRACDKDMA